MKKWSDYLTSSNHIAREMWVSERTVNYWSQKNKVPEWHFASLEKVLALIGHKLTPTEMRELNDKPQD